jgi:hypothetical protein
MEKCNITHAKRATITTATVCCVSAAGCCARPMVNTKRQEQVLT